MSTQIHKHRDKYINTGTQIFKPKNTNILHIYKINFPKNSQPKIYICISQGHKQEYANT